MKKTVVLAEKPSVGRDLARVLGCTKQGNGYMEGKQYIVTWALGHLVTLATPDMYDQKYNTWRLEDLPMLPNRLKTIVIKKTGKQFNTVKQQLNRQDVGSIVIATDAGREGELVARWIIEKARVKKPMKRLWISSVTDQAIRNGFKQLQEDKKYRNLYESAVARSEADWYVGLNATRALATKFNAQLSSGRVQTPTLAIVAAREEEINQFKSQAYYQIEALVKRGFTLTWQDSNGHDRIFSEKKANELVERLSNKDGQVVDVKKVLRKQFAPQLYDLTELQRDANRIFNFSGKQTLNIMQSLYERHKILTYPRTDSRVITTDIVPTLMDRVKASAVGEYKGHAQEVQRRLTGRIRLPKSVVDNAKVSDHHAIIPTEQPVYLGELTAQERKIYDLVIRRFLAVLSEAHEYEQMTVDVLIEKERFVAKGKVVNKLGWKQLYQRQQMDDVESSLAEDQQIPPLKKGDMLQSLNIVKKRGETKPPSRFTEGTLLQAMENPVRFMNEDEKHLAKTIKHTGGLGTVATRADIIDKLFNSMYIELKGKYIHLTSTGRQLLELAPEALRSPALTAEWEQKLSLIAEGQLTREQFMKDIRNYTTQIVTEIKQSDDTFRHDNVTGSHCPDCGKLMLEINNQHGKMLVCQDRSCGHKKNVFKRTNARCPKCKKRMVLHGEGEGQTFSCVCGHREKRSSFLKRRQEEKKHHVSKREVNRYLQKQDDGFKNNALAEALARFKK